MLTITYPPGCRSAASQGHQATCRTLFKESICLFFGIVSPVALAQFALGFIPECVFAPLGPAGRLPQLMGAVADLLNGRDAHLRTHKSSWSKSQRGLLQLVPLRTRTSGSTGDDVINLVIDFPNHSRSYD
jgi:hypothetical protein